MRAIPLGILFGGLLAVPFVSGQTFSEADVSKVSSLKIDTSASARDLTETSMIESLYRFDLLPQLRPGVYSGLFTSRDRTGGNNDGFDGTHSKLRLENGNSVIAEEPYGAGCIKRIQCTHSLWGEYGILGNKGEHIKIYVDGNYETPVLDIPMIDLFTGKHESFPQPIVGNAHGGFYCYVPIPFRNGFKVVIEGDHVRFFHITYQMFPEPGNLVSFTEKQTPSQKAAMDKAVDVWKQAGNLDVLLNAPSETTTFDVNLQTNEVRKFELPRGPHIVRAVKFTGTKGERDRAGQGVIQFHFDDGTKPSANLPLDFFFLNASNAIPIQSLLVGTTGETWYNYMPMPYYRNASLTLFAPNIKEGMVGKLEIVTEKLLENYAPFGYFHAKYNSQTPTMPGEYYEYLRHNGRGHLIGLYMDTDGNSAPNMCVWMEGDDRWFTDGFCRGLGNGSEDFFNGGWYSTPGRLTEPGFSPTHGFPTFRGENGKFWTAAYRWFIVDSVCFEQSILSEIEHGAINNDITNYRSAAFFYDVTP